jgi:hypothetical protein
VTGTDLERNDDIRMTNGGKSVQDFAVGHQVSIVQSKRNDERKMTNGVILPTGYEALDCLPAVKDREIESLVDMVMGGPA